ncbi:MAG: HD domain-containing phosphohydrolase [Myxococcota bacterium]
MNPIARNTSIIPKEFDRVPFVAYLLGGVVPLVGLGIVLGHHPLTAVFDSPSALPRMVAVASIVMLSSGCLLMLRRIAKRTLSQLVANNLQLESLLAASQSLAVAQHENDAIDSAVRGALTLTDARAACVFLRNKGDDPLEVSASMGVYEPEIHALLMEPLVDLVDFVMREGRPATRGPAASGGEHGGTAIQSAVVVPLPGEESPLGALAVIHTDADRDFDAADVDILSTLAGLASVAMVSAELRFTQRNFFSHVTDILVTAVDVHLGYHGGHGRRVAQLANRVGRELKLDEKQMERLHFGALLHDVGMLKIDRSISHTPKICEKHPSLGFRMLHGIRLWDEVAPLVLYHHERFDGTGYPEGLRGEAIPLESRIIAVCEAFDSMTSETSYKSPVSFEDAMREIEMGAGAQFDPTVARAFIDVFSERAAIADGSDE